MKMKHRMDDDFVVCEYIKGNYLTSIVLEQFRERELVYKSHLHPHHTEKGRSGYLF